MQEPTKSITIMKYKGKDNKYHFVVKDKFDIPSAPARLDAMLALRDSLLASGEMQTFLWVKETVLF